jgi:hypothetical protein
VLALGLFGLALLALRRRWEVLPIALLLVGIKLHQGTAAGRGPSQPSGDADRARARGVAVAAAVSGSSLADMGRNLNMAEQLTTRDTAHPIPERSVR